MQQTVARLPGRLRIWTQSSANVVPLLKWHLAPTCGDLALALESDKRHIIAQAQVPQEIASVMMGFDKGYSLAFFFHKDCLLHGLVRHY